MKKSLCTCGLVFVGRNAEITAIDQAASIVAPLVAGVSLAFFGYKGACAIFVATNLAFWALERALLMRVYAMIVELHTRERAPKGSRKVLRARGHVEFRRK